MSENQNPISVETLIEKNYIQKKMPILAIDPGKKNIGLALSDTHHIAATPLYTIQRKNFTQTAKIIFDLIEEENICAVIVGFPINMNATYGPKAQSAQKFAQNLAKIINIPVALWDERLSTQAITKILIKAGVTRQKRNKIDNHLAASWILQGVLDRIRISVRLK